ncbi:hypothetical protein HU200_040555 [Digitaria exilis]|uniref:Uncharacterized protein n=1 Tax=Digitaria exilis TaxID=1010633 RepID=A0A835B989_9POAL|nr:hypothetical protein HU200_040555 [Digitaria exilis]
MHLFFYCPFSQACWNFLDIHWNTTLDFQLMFLRGRERIGSFFMATWVLWIHRISIILDGGSLSFANWK